MSEEFNESEILFSDNYFPLRRGEDVKEKENRTVDLRKRVRNYRSRSKTTSVQVPFSSSVRSEEEYSDDDDEGGRRMVPPHLIVRRRIEGSQMAFSVCTGYGRTLKGRDLSRVRNSVLRLTGFLEA